MKGIFYRVASISELHDIAGFEKPKHPLVSVVDYSKINSIHLSESTSFVFDFYSINFKKNCQLYYGRQLFDHQEGTLLCTAPEQIITFDKNRDSSGTDGWGLFFHPELIRKSNLGKKIHEYTFFTYDENEALHISHQEKETLLCILNQIKNEYNTNIDHYSKDLILTNIELLLNYCQRYYGRQFITRTNQNKDILVRFEDYLRNYIYSDEIENKGIPSVKNCAEFMNLSPNYFSDLLKSETGKNTQEHIHFYLLEKAKTMLVNSNMSINEIAYKLGFEYPQNFSKLFKNKIGLSPTEFRNRIINN